MPLPVEPAGVHPVASSPLARIAAAAQRARGGASPRPESGVPAAAERAVEAKPAEVTAREASSRETGAGAESNAGTESNPGSGAAGSASPARAASRVPTPTDLMRSGVRPLPAAPVSARGVRLYASSASEDADPAAGLDEDLRLKLLSALQGMAEEEPREEPVKAEVPKPAAPKPAAPKPVAPKPTAPKPAPPKQAQPAAGESATSAPVPAPAQKAEPQPAPAQTETSAAPAPKPAPPKQAQPAEAAGESASAPVQKAEPKPVPVTPAAPVGVPAAEPTKPVRPTPALFGKVQVSAAESVAEEIAAVDSAEAAAEIEARAASEAELNAELEPVELEAGELEESARIHPQQVREMHENFAEQSRPIVLIGPMAAGKTYIGTHLARFYGYEFLDADQLIVERYGEVSEIFEIFGEAHFRELERKTIEEVLTSPVYRNTVFSLGGGAPMTDSVAELLKDECVVYILVDAETVTPRITGNKTRPLLQPNPVERWTDIFERRRTRYEELAHFTLDARGGRPITEMTAEIQAYVTATRASRAQRPQA